MPRPSSIPSARSIRSRADMGAPSRMHKLPDPGTPMYRTSTPGAAPPAPGDGQPYIGGALDTSGACQPTGGDWEKWFYTMFPGQSLSHDDLVAREAELKRYGVTLAPNAAGRVGKINVPGIGRVDVVQGGESGYNRRQFLYTPVSATGAAASSPV